ncbi:MAG TPA: cytochrome c oxidase assembly protein [Streptosporangiaceae bacterium]|nr:cytochrome c oxidase assembly protein [Streptosporangiaceae bacterium]
MPVQLPPELTPVRKLTEWSIDPYALALIVLACAAYLLGVRRVRLAGENWPAGRTIAFCAGGAGLAFIATSSFLAVYWPVLFFVRAFQTVVLLLAVPLFIMLGLVFFWTLLRVDPVPRQYPYLVALWVTAAEVVGDAALGLSVIVDRNLIAGGYYHALGRPWGPSLASDQVLGGGALWILGDLIGLPFLAAVLIAMIREDEHEAKVIDAELDAADQPGADEAEAKPWWVADPRFSDRFAPVESKIPDQD